MKRAEYIKRLILAAAIASTMALTVIASVPRSTAERVARDAGATAFQVADKGSDGQETHG